MNYIIETSLEHSAVESIVISLWYGHDIWEKTKAYFSSPNRDNWQMIEDTVKQNVSQLPLPESIKNKVIDYIKPVGLEVLQWKEYHDKMGCNLGLALPDNRCWTSRGTVNKKKTAQKHVKDESLDITVRYKLACLYCFKEDVLELWHKMPETHRKSFYSSECPTKIEQHELVVFWTYDVMEEVAKLENVIERRWQHRCSTYQYAFECAASCGNKTATEYFIQNLTPNERKESVMRSVRFVAARHGVIYVHMSEVPRDYFAEVLCYLLSQMDHEQQLTVFQRHTCGVLKYLVHWPWQQFFLETANQTWDFIPQFSFQILLDIMISKICASYKDYNYQKLYLEFFLSSPPNHRRSVVREYLSPERFKLAHLFDVLDMDIIKLILREALDEEKEIIIFHEKGMSRCADLIYEGKWDLLTFFVQECLSSTNMMVKFREEFEERNKCDYYVVKLREKQHLLHRLYGFLDDLIAKGGSIEEGDGNPANKHRRRANEVTHWDYKKFKAHYLTF